MIAEAEAEFRAGRINDAAKTGVYSLASDLRSAAYVDAQQRHRARIAALKREFVGA
jgi:hypothetical protein